MSFLNNQLYYPEPGGHHQESSAPQSAATALDGEPIGSNEFTDLLNREWTNEELLDTSLLLPGPGIFDDLQDRTPDIAPDGPEEFNMVVVEVGYVLRTRTAEERFASSKDVAYDIEILKELNLMSFARERDNDPLGYLLVGREGRQLAFVPLYVPKTFSGTITPEVLDSEINNVKHIGFFHPRRIAASSTWQENPDEFLFIAPLLVADDIQYQDMLEKCQGGGDRSWLMKEDCVAAVQEVVIWNDKIHPPHDYSSRKRVRSHATEIAAKKLQKKPLGKKKAPYVPGGDAEFGLGWEKPKVKRKPAKPNVPKDPVTREALLILRKNLQYDDPVSGPAPVPYLFGGDISVRTYAEDIYNSSVELLGVNHASISDARKSKILFEITQLVPSQYNTYHQWAQWQIEGKIKKGGYGIPVSLPPEVRRAKAAKLLENYNFLYEGGANRLPTAVKYSHWSIRQANWRNFQANIHTRVHPHGISRQNTGEHFKIPSLYKAFPVLGGAATVSFIHDELVELSGSDEQVRQRLAFFADMKSSSNIQAQVGIWPDWVVKQKTPAGTPVGKPNRKRRYQPGDPYQSGDSESDSENESDSDGDDSESDA